ncbi:UbiX family flavin prenyltransferase [Leisingera sp. ANG59]|uniref:UbiX family flavin prenyltransferase n=1 Tax=Leisingera sp. ANG59 TaxID=2675221 RepID=UPI0015731105|nr:UbiX family flavin prenyltransferase [Leisingera sp. ANG59]NSY39861.1 UbiX family flavin prenyltransferase [Leisingera sp. ANG59]
MSGRRIVLGVSGASGALLGLAVARHLRRLGVEIDLVTSAAAERTLAQECGAGAAEELRAMAARCHPVHDIGAAIASGSVPVSGMIVAPCSMRSLAAIAHGLDDNLLTRAAGVQLKERRRLVLLARETPLTLAHLRNMASVTEMGAVVMPPVPAFYLAHGTLAEAASQVAARAVDLMALSDPCAQPWSPQQSG